MYSDVDPICDRCRQAPATLAHMFWFCPTPPGYWSEIFETMSQVVGTAIKPVSMTALFGRLPLSVCCFLLHWKSSAPPTHSLRINDVFHFITLKIIRYSLRGFSKNLYQMWGSLLGYMETCTPCILDDSYFLHSSLQCDGSCNKTISLLFQWVIWNGHIAFRCFFKKKYWSYNNAAVMFFVIFVQQ